MKISFLAFVLLLIHISSTDVYSQVKFEREYRIKKKDVPVNAQKFIDVTFTGERIKWYAEESQDGKTIEAKAKFDNHSFSIEFDLEGTLLDVEKAVLFENLELPIRQQINDSLTKRFGTYRVNKVQIQWKGQESTLSELIVSGRSSENYQQKYELIIETRTDHHFAAFEILFSEAVGLEKVLEIDLRNQNNMEF